MNFTCAAGNSPLNLSRYAKLSIIVGKVCFKSL
jgi:hypothetical protein